MTKARSLGIATAPLRVIHDPAWAVVENPRPEFQNARFMIARTG